MHHFEHIRSQFPIFQQYPELIYLDNAATTQKPKVVIDRMVQFYTQENANIHRGVYALAAKATQVYENSRATVSDYLAANDPDTIVFTKGTTEGINLVVSSFLAPRLQPGDNVVISAMEHHANLVPWQMICKAKGAELRVIPIQENGDLDLQVFQQLLDPKTRMVAVVHISNTLGTINPIEKILEACQEQHIPVLLDVAQSIAHYEINARTLGVDFLVFSGHKVFGPTGIGVLYGKMEHLQQMPPYQFGGDMIREVTFEQTTFAAPPGRFEAGTPPIAAAAGLAAALEFIGQFPKSAVQEHLQDLTNYCLEQMARLPGLKVLGHPRRRTGIISFLLEGVHPHDVATFLDQAHIAVRAGHHCTQPVMDYYEIPGSTRASFTIYNTRSEVDNLVQTLSSILAFFS